MYLHVHDETTKVSEIQKRERMAIGQSESVAALLWRTTADNVASDSSKSLMCRLEDVANRIKSLSLQIFAVEIPIVTRTSFGSEFHLAVALAALAWALVVTIYAYYIEGSRIVGMSCYRSFLKPKWSAFLFCSILFCTALFCSVPVASLFNGIGICELCLS